MLRMVTSYNSNLQTIQHQNKEILNQVSIIPSQDRVIMIIFMYPQIRLFNKHKFLLTSLLIYYVLC